jgi:hypothetical protein
MAGHDDPHTHSANIREMLSNVIEHAREDINKVDDPSARPCLKPQMRC